MNAITITINVIYLPTGRRQQYKNTKFFLQVATEDMTVKKTFCGTIGFFNISSRRPSSKYTHRDLLQNIQSPTFLKSTPSPIFTKFTKSFDHLLQICTIRSPSPITTDQSPSFQHTTYNH